MAKPNDMPEFHSVKVSLTQNIPEPVQVQLVYAIYSVAGKGGRYHV
ncbi:hypothetical protein SG34_008735 [Thalassomonas viridans]|uniref:Uncharacterized protein n=1 Tax=Thalassomonas viridans TaxID=137584 RepID=A0AAF0C8Z5_9GAMM|nr:hypothetical protein [Thalassomonas viridans]WDE06957.1 hypothetical protein SG34_008735 [Thalassomonas viridans]